jgi:L-amino acid N-acyltransferase YncA
MIREVSLDDAAEIAAVYNHYVRNTHATFEEEDVTTAAMAERIGRVMSAYPWFVAEEEGVLTGYSYAGPFHARAAYRLTAETTVYLRPGCEGRGTGAALYEALLATLRRRDLHAAIGIIALPNPASVALHERFGFGQVGRLVEVGRKFDRWIDVGIWQLQLSPAEAE